MKARTAVIDRGAGMGRIRCGRILSQTIMMTHSVIPHSDSQSKAGTFVLQKCFLMPVQV